MAKDLGLVTAYGYAQAGGYTGTEAEFEMMLANAGRGIVSVELTSTVGYVKTYTITFTDGTTTTFDVTDGEVSQAELDTKADAIVDSATGDIASITDGADDVPVKSLKVNIVPKQSGSGDPSPSNVRPITGWDEVEVVRAGVNVFDEVMELGSISDGTGENSSASDRLRTKNFIEVKSGVQYYSTIATRLLFYDANKTYMGLDKSISLNSASVFTVPSGASYVRFGLGSSYGTTYNHDISINYPSTDTEYHAHQGTSYTISLPSTVYGGTLNVTTGELVIDSAKIVYDGTLPIAIVNWIPTSNGVGWAYGYIRSHNKIVAGNVVPKIYSDKLKASTYNSMLNGTNTNAIGVYTNSEYGIFIRTSDTSLTTVEAINNYLSANPITVVYELANPTTVQLTPTEVTTLLGNNNIYSDAGSVEVEYRADTKLYIDKKINALI